ncbi:MAG: hypothetical protein R2746_16465 [Acidimicrobiales bacterium]
MLDEPTASLDVDAEVALFDQLLTHAAGCTAIVVSHRFSTVRRADRIVVVADGAVVEDAPTTSCSPSTGDTPASTTCRPPASGTRWARELGCAAAPDLVPATPLRRRLGLFARVLARSSPSSACWWR